MRIKDMGLMLAGLWFIATGLIALLGLRFNGMHTIMGALALVAGILLFLRR